ncbi:MAG TPA: helix-turn-helix transcriptional regulator [Streptosporangiaceae bacterium]
MGLVEATVSKLYSRMRIGAVGASTHTKITRRVIAPGLSFDDLDYSFDLAYSAEAQSKIIISDVVSSTIRRIGEGCDETFGPGDLFLISRPGLPYSGVGHAARVRLTVLDPAICAQVAMAPEGSAAGPVSILGHRPVSRQSALHLQRTMAYVRDCVMAEPEAAQAPLVVSAATRFLAASVLQAFPNSAVLRPEAEHDQDAHPGTLRRAVAFIDASPDSDITVADIARAACVTPRAVQLAFRRHLDTTPMEYLRRIRLDHAHRDLTQASPGDGTTVTTVSYRWGFPSPSRFATSYRAAYGVPPNDTLRR